MTFYGPGERIPDLIPEEGVVDLRELGLNERQIEALRLMMNEGMNFTNERYRERFGVSQATAYRDLLRLVEKDLVQERGKYKDKVYFYPRET